MYVGNLIARTSIVLVIFWIQELKACFCGVMDYEIRIVHRSNVVKWNQEINGGRKKYRQATTENYNLCDPAITTVKSNCSWWSRCLLWVLTFCMNLAIDLCWIVRWWWVRRKHVDQPAITTHYVWNQSSVCTITRSYLDGHDCIFIVSQTISQTVNKQSANSHAKNYLTEDQLACWLIFTDYHHINYININNNNINKLIITNITIPPPELRI